MNSISLISLLFLFALPVAYSAPDNDLSSLKDTSFAITSSIIRTQNDPDPPPVHLIEAYSSEQKRSRLFYDNRADESRRWEEFIFDSHTWRSLFYLRTSQECSKGTLELFYEELFGKDSMMVEFFNAIDGQLANETLAHVIGPAKVLFLIENKWNLFDQYQGEQMLIRNHQTVRYDWKWPESKIRIVAYYDKRSIGNSFGSIKNLLPLQLIIYPFERKSSEAVELNFYTLQRLPLHEIIPNTFNSLDMNLLSAGPTGGGSTSALVDLFAFPAGFNCSEYLGSLINRDLLHDYDPQLVRFSATIDTYDLNYDNERHFVAYDGMTESVRLESSRDGKFDGLASVWDLSLNRKYQMRRKFGVSGGVSETRLASCVVTQIWDSRMETSSRFNFQLSQFLFGATEFAYMGKARVNGIACKVFEAYTSSLPDWYAWPMLVSNMNGLSEQRRGKMSRGKFNTLVYVADNDNENQGEQPLIQVLQLEVFDLRAVRNSGYRMQMRARLHNFRWDLAESPGGEKVHELFSVSRACALGDRDERFAQVNLLLEEEKSEDKLGEPAKNFTWLERSTADRNKALVAAIKDSLGVLNTVLYDFQSRLLKPERALAGSGRHSLLVDFRVAEHPQILNSLTLVTDKITLKPSSGSLRYLFITANSLAECLTLIGEPADKRVVHVYFNERVRKCFMDPDLPTTPAEADPRKSKLFEFDDSTSGSELYRVEGQLDFETNVPNHWLRDGKSQRMENRKLLLQNVEPDDSGAPATIDSNTMMVRVRRLKLTSNNYLGEVSPGGSQQLRRSFAGLKLPVAFKSDSGLTVRRLLASDLGGESSRTQLSSGMVSLQLCEAACLEQLDCRSFSYCTHFADSECLLSNFSIQSLGVQMALSTASSQKQPNNPKVPVLIDSTGQWVELIKSRNCELHSKHYTAMFQKTYSTLTTLNRMQLFGVRELDECAQICFGQSLEALEELGGLREIVRDLPQQADHYETLRSLESDLKRREAHLMAEFCDYFLFVETASLSVPQAGELLKRVNNTRVPQGYCLISEKKPPKNSTSPPPSEIEHFKASYYSFNYLSLYERHHGFGIRQSPAGGELKDAYSRFLSAPAAGSAPDEADYKLVRQFLVEGGNFQIKFNVEPGYCANACFRQTSVLWPACQSFDTLHVPNSRDQDNTVSCNLNTLSLDDIRSSNRTQSLIQFKDSGEPTQMWHYELRFGVLKANARTQFELELEETKLKLRELNSHPFRLWASSRLAGKSIFAIVALSLASGLLLGVQLARKLLVSGLQLWGAPQETNLVESSTIQDVAMSLRGKGTIPYDNLQEEA